MPYSYLYPPGSKGDEQQYPWRHPVERSTEFFFEAEMAMEKFGTPYHIWLKTMPKAARIAQLIIYRRSLLNEAYYNTPKDERFAFFNKR